jgi:ferredoxin
MKILAKSRIVDLLRYSNASRNVYVPVDSEQGDLLFTLLPKSGDELELMLEAVNLDDQWVVIPPKDLLFPQQEDMFHFDGEKIIENIENSPKLIFGIKPCDLKGMLFSDAFYRRDFDDVYYLSRAKDRLVVVIGCINPPRPGSCFCTSTKTGPFADGGYDLQLVDSGESYLVEIGSKQGHDFIDTYSVFFSEAEGTASDYAEEIKRSAAKNIKLEVDFDKALEIMKGEYDFGEIYQRIGERCLYCGGCLYTCPTCTCFNVVDESDGESGVRRRIWDGCVYKGYTSEASGHNPRTEKWIRTARRYEHKLKYDCMVAGESGCVGCGRCLSSCPVNIGMSKFIQEITENKRTM